MALQLDTIAASTLNGSRSNGGYDAVFKSKSSHSPSSNDSGFHSDQLTQQQQHQQRHPQPQRPTSRNRNVKHKPTYVSVFATDPDYSSPLFDQFDRRFSAKCLFVPLQNLVYINLTRLSAVFLHIEGGLTLLHSGSR